jgi:hypothetical protein
MVASLVAAAAAAARRRIEIGVLDVALLAGLAAFAGWVAISIVWTRTVPQSVLEVERALVYVGVVGAGLVIVSRRSIPLLLGGVLGAICVVAGYALFTRLFPERFDTFDAIAGYRLTGPIGYWNALGIFAVLGIVLAVGFAARAELIATRAAAAASLVVLVPALYFTYSRGAWAALIAGLLAVLAVDGRRLQMLVTSLAVAVPPTIAVAVAARSRGLTHTDTSLDVATQQGHRLALLLLPLGALAVLAVGVVWGVERRVSVAARTRRALNLALGLACIGAALGVIMGFGGPASLAERAAHEFDSPAATNTDLNARVFSLSSRARVDQYRVAWHAFRDHPWTGTGAGSFEQHWLIERDVPAKVRDAHSLYLETLSDLGVVGLALLLLTLCVPLFAGFLSSWQPLIPAAFGAYVAYLVHAGVDWDWEMPAVTLPALACAIALVVSARGRTRLLGNSARTAFGVAAVGLATVAFVGLVGNSEIDRAGDAIRARDFPAASAPARNAISWAPWSADGWRRLGQAQLGMGQEALARPNLRKAITKDPLNWDRWFDLALATHGAEQRRALSRALELNPRSPELAEFIRGVGLTGFDVAGE